MSSLRDFFGSRHVILPVIHVESAAQALRNARIVTEAGCDGAFLINHASRAKELLDVHASVSRQLPDLWMGVNFLDVRPSKVFSKLGEAVGGVWTDNALIDEVGAGQPRADRVRDARARSGWRGLYFGGVAFKYQDQVDDLETAARVATKYMDVVTTSGSGTGIAAATQKIATMKKAIGDFPLAIASGITPENVESYLPVADCFLVATGIGRSWTELDPARVRKLVEVIRRFPG